MAIKTSISLDPRLDTQIASRGENRSGVINRDLERLYTLYSRAIREVSLSADEACLIVDTLNGTLMDANTARLLWANVEDACTLDHLDKKWEVDGPALVEKLQGLNDIQAMALVDAAERFWNSPDIGNVDIQERVKEHFNIKE